MHRSPASEIALSPAAWERIAKDWLVEVIERTPLDDVDKLPIAWIAREATPLIAEILGQLSDHGSARVLDLPPAARDRAAALAAGHLPESAGQVPRELAALQALIVEALGREVCDQDRGEFARAVSRLAEVFGAVQSAALDALPRHAATEAATAPDRVAGHPREDQAPGKAELLEWLGIVIDECRAACVPFAVAHVEVDGFERIAAAYGAAAADRMVTAVLAVIEGESRERDRAFRIASDQIVLLRERSDASGLADLGSRITEVVDSAQSPAGPRVAVALGLSSFPQHGETPEVLLDAAEQAAWSAAARGEGFAVAGATRDR